MRGLTAPAVARDRLSGRPGAIQAVIIAPPTCLDERQQVRRPCEPSQVDDLRSAIGPLARLARGVECTAQTIANLIAQEPAASGKASTQAPVKDGPTGLEREELVRLRRDDRQLKTERDILAKGRGIAPTAWFARSGETRSRSSSGSSWRTRPTSRYARCAECCRCRRAACTAGPGAHRAPDESPTRCSPGANQLWVADMTYVPTWAGSSTWPSCWTSGVVGSWVGQSARR